MTVLHWLRRGALRPEILSSIPPRWQRLAIVVGVLLSSVGMGVLSMFLAARDRLSQLGLIIVVAAAIPLGIAALQFILNRPELIPILILVAAAYIPLFLPTGTGSKLADSFLVTSAFVGLWILDMVRERRFKIVPSPVNAPILVFAALTLWSIGWSVVFRDPLVWAPNSFIVVQVASGVVNIMLPMAALLVSNFIHDLRPLKWMVGLMLLAAALGLIKRYDLFNLPINTEGLFNMWAMTLACAFALFATRWTFWQRGLMLALSAAYVVWGLFLHIDWLAGWLPGMFALGLLAWQRSWKLAVALALVVAVVVTLKWSYIQQAFNAEDSESGGTRLAAWAANWSITKDHLIFGTGPAGYAAYYMSYFPTNAMATHSNYIDMLAQNGIIGFAAVLLLFFQLAWIGYRLTQRVRGRGDFVEALANAAFAGTMACILAMGFGDWLFPFAYTQTIAGFDYEVYSWLFMGTTLVLERLTRPTLAVAPAAHA